MKTALLASLPAVTALASIRAADTPLINASAREALTLNGRWHVIVDPYDNGFVNYRLDQFDAVAKATGGYFLDRKPAVITADGMTLVSSTSDSVGKTPWLAVDGSFKIRATVHAAKGMKETSETNNTCEAALVLPGGKVVGEITTRLSETL